MPKRSTRMALIAVPTLIASLAVPALANASPAATTATIPHTKPLWISHAKSAGPATAAVSARVYLAPNGGMAALAAFAKSVSTPGSANFHKFLSTRQYYARFGTTNSTVSKVESYLTSAGLRVTGVEAHNRYISITGSVAAANRAFGTSIQRYSHDGQNVQAPSSDLRVPTAIAGAVTTVAGLDTTMYVSKPASPDVSTSASPAVRLAAPRSATAGRARCIAARSARSTRLTSTPRYRSSWTRAVLCPVWLYRPAVPRSLRRRQHPDRCRRHGGDHRRLRRSHYHAGLPGIRAASW